MQTTLRINDGGYYSGPIHKWVKKPVPVGTAGAQGQLHLLKWVRTDEVVEASDRPRHPWLVPVGKDAAGAPSAADDDAGDADARTTTTTTAAAGAATGGGPGGAPSASQQQPSQSAPYSGAVTEDGTEGMDLTGGASEGGFEQEGAAAAGAAAAGVAAGGGGGAGFQGAAVFMDVDAAEGDMPS